LEPKAVLEAFVDGMNRCDLDAILGCLAQDVVDHSPMPGQQPGIEGWRSKWEALSAGFSDLRIEIEQSVAEGDTVAARYTMRATNTGEFMGGPPTGKRIEVPVFDMCRVRDGKFIDLWRLMDSMSMMAQLGLAPSAG
jgi:predicted ester cyclase